ncbi:MAG: mucoidy inhibitor MuiA family protein [Microscillaceae bacterium]|nr:mucoidy inhibitor MuiA family protein [Microscillaceae bacterium]
MKIKILLVWICLFPHLLFSQAEPIFVSTKIAQVTVFLSGAEVSRNGEVQIPAGETELLFRGLSPNLNKESIQVKGEGAFTVLSVVHQRNFLKEQETRAEVEAMEKKIEAQQDEKTQLTAQLDVFVQEEKMLAENREIGGDNTGLRAADLREAMDFHRTRLQDIKNQQLTLQKRLRALEEVLLSLQKQLLELRARPDQSTSEVVVKVKAAASVRAKFTLAYLVEEAGWFPSYDLRVKDINSPVQLSYKANVYQNSGENWPQVKLILSTGNPSESGLKPDLAPWYLRYGQRYAATQRKTAPPSLGPGEVSGRILDAETGEPIPGVSLFIKGATRGTITDANGQYTLVTSPGEVLVIQSVGYERQEIQLSGERRQDIFMNQNTQELGEIVVSGVSTRGGRAKPDISRDELKKEKDRPDIPLTTQTTETQISLSFIIEVPYTIPSDGKTRLVEIKQHALQATYEYYAAPKLDPDAFLTARITDWEEYNLLDGEASLFFEGTYLGRTLLTPRQTGDTLEISLGRDKNVVIKRTAGKEFTKKQFIGNNQTLTRGWEITVRNQKAQAIDLVLEDQFPISTINEIVVERQDRGGAEENAETGQLTWKFSLKPSEERKVGFRYTVKYPRGKTLYLD